MARFDGGWIKIHRSIVDSDIFQRGPFTFGIWIKLLLMANWKESSMYFGGNQIKVQPGQLVTGLKEILGPDVDACDPHLNRTRGVLAYLEKTGRILQTKNNQGRLITILKWDTYQRGNDVVTDQEQSDHNRGTIDPQLSEEGKKGRRKKAGTVNPAPAAGIYLRIDELLASRGVNEETQRAWKAAYPDDSWVIQKVLDAAAWEVSNPSRKKKNFAAFVTRWLAKDWDRRTFAPQTRQTINTTPIKLEGIA